MRVRTARGELGPFGEKRREGKHFKVYFSPTFFAIVKL
jgi:hypothetical protein